MSPLSRGHTFRVVQDGLVVASAFADDEASARNEINHYAAQYRQDGPIVVQHRPPGAKRYRRVS